MKKKYDFSSLLFVFHLLINLKASNLFSNTKSIGDLHYIEKPNLLDVLSSFVDVMSVDVLSVDVLSVDVMSVDVLSYIRTELNVVVSFILSTPSLAPI